MKVHSMNQRTIQPTRILNRINLKYESPTPLISSLPPPQDYDIPAPPQRDDDIPPPPQDLLDLNAIKSNITRETVSDSSIHAEKDNFSEQISSSNFIYIIKHGIGKLTKLHVDHLINEKEIHDVTIDCFAKIVFNEKTYVMQHETATNILVNGNYN